jgi:transcriptional regulator with XRE-family HTH domain
MALLSVIRRWHFQEHLSIRAIARRTGLSRNTIRKFLRSEAVEPVFRTPDRRSKLDPFTAALPVPLSQRSRWSRRDGPSCCTG